MIPIVYGMEKAYSGRITLVHANIHNPETFALQKDLGFTMTPEFFLLDKDGKVLGHWDESASITDLKNGIDDVLASSSKQ
ncbi:MAG: hypothetical protein EXR62_06180 [Chloroflexi bacterium]|nr:hypothetical protein [Chloroflexota bacterium]